MVNISRRIDRILDSEMRQWLSDRYNCDPNVDIDVDGEAVLVTGIMPNTNQRGEFYAGDLGELRLEFERGQ